MKALLCAFLTLVLLTCVCPLVEASSYPIYDVDYCITSIGWITDDGVIHSGGMCEEAMYAGDTLDWNVVSIVPLIDWGEKWGIMGDYAHSAWLSIPAGSLPSMVAAEWIANDIEQRWLAQQKGR